MGQDWASLGVRPSTSRKLWGLSLVAVVAAGSWYVLQPDDTCLRGLDGGRTTWAEAALTSYELTYEVWEDQVTVTVIDGAVASVAPDRSGAPVYTVEDLFDRAEGLGLARGDGAEGDPEFTCEADWDDTYGFPTRIEAELVNGIDDPPPVHVTDFSPQAVELPES